MARKITAEYVAAIQTPRDVRLSPCGKRVVYALRSCQVKNESNRIVSSIWTAEVGKENSARQLTPGTYNDAAPRYSPDGKYISFLSDRANLGKASAVYLLPVDGGEARSLTSPENEKSVGFYKWRPDSKSIAFVSSDEWSKEKAQRIKNELNDAKVYGEDWECGRLRLVDVKTSTVTTLYSADLNVTDLAWNREGDKIVIAAALTTDIDDCYSGSNSVMIVNVQDKRVRNVCNYPVIASQLAWEEHTIYWIGTCDADIGSVISANCVVKIDSNIDNATYEKYALGTTTCAHLLQQCNGGLVVHECEGLTENLMLLHSSKLLYDSEKYRMRSWDAAITDHGTTVVLTKSSVAVPDEIFSYVGGKLCQLTQHNKEFADLALGQPLMHNITAPDGTPIDGVVALPKSLVDIPPKDRKPHKAIVLVHGGPYDRSSTEFEMQCFQWSIWLLSQGYVLVYPFYRGGKGYGNDFAKAARGHAAASYQDIITLVKHYINEGIVDEKRCAIGGWSQGGFLSYLAVTRDTTFHFAAAIAGAGVTDWDTMASTADLWHLETELSGQQPWNCSISDTQGRTNSPLYHMDDIKTPVLILHGEEDKRVPVTQAYGFHRGMLTRKKECEMVIYPREPHADPFERAHVIHMLKTIQVFLAKHIG